MFPIIFFTNCSKEQIVENNTSSNLNFTKQTPINEQLPHSSFDSSEKGLYHGVIASGVNLTRGKIWVNIGNDSQYNAIVQLVNGDKIFYQLTQEAGSIKSNTYSFSGERGAFNINLNDINEPIIYENTLDNEEVFAKVVKGTNGRMPHSFNGFFTDNVSNPTFSGTWNLISTGDLAPEGRGYELINSVVVTFNANMYTDNNFETFNYPCVGNPALNAQMGSLPGNASAVISHEQTSNFHGVTNWDLGTGNGTYTNNMCQFISSGSFSWTHQSNGIMKSGEIYIDL